MSSESNERNRFFEEAPVLVTGATGLIGSNLVKALHAAGANLRATIHRSKPLEILPGVDYAECDVLSPDDCERVTSGMRYVFHCSAISFGAGAMKSAPVATLAPNFKMDLNILEAAHGNQVQKLLWLSSTTIYPPTGSTAVAEDQWLAEEPFDNYHFVGWFKRFSEVVCRMYGERSNPSLPVIVLRPSAIYGPGDHFDPQRSHVIPALIRKVVEGQNPLNVWGTGNEERDFLFVDDAVDAMLSAMARIDSYTALNIGSGSHHTIRQVVNAILKAASTDSVRVEFDATKPSAIPIRRIDTSRAAQLIGFKAQTGLEEGIRRTMEWYRSQVAQRA
jgi:GDP-L-fucose synthase